MNRTAQSCCTAVHIRNIFLSAKTFCDCFTHGIFRCHPIVLRLFSCFYICFRIKLGFHIIILTTRCLKIKLFNHEFEDKIIQEEIKNADRNHPHPACLFISLQNTEQEEVQKSAGKGKTYCDIQDVCDHISCSRKNNLHDKQRRCNKQEREFQWFCDTGCHTRKCCGKKQTACCFFLLRFRTMVHGKCRSRKSENHKNKFSGEISRCICTEMCDIRRIRKLCEENILSALHHLSCHFHGTSDCCLPERHIEYVMQTKWNQCSLNQTENQRSDITGAGYQATQRINAVLYNRPYKIHYNSHKHIDDRRNNRYKTSTSKERKCIRKLDPVKTIMKCSNSKTDNNTAKHTHLQ